MATRNTPGTCTGATQASVDLVKVDTAATVLDLANATDGLGALKILIDAVQTDLDNGTDGLGALKALLDAIPVTMVGTNLAFTALVGGALATAAHTGEVDEATTVMGYTKQMATNSEKIVELSTHVTEIFPAVTNLTCTLTAHANANEWSAYTEIVDSAATTLSASFAACEGHITGMITESANEDATVYMVELSYGASHDVISEWRLVSGTNKVSSTGQSSARGDHIPLGETVYARVMCATAGAKTLSVHFRHFCHS